MDGLRAIACLTVFLANFHNSMGMTVSGRVGPFDFATFAESGIGVLMLIVMSGGLLSLPFWRRLEGGREVSLRGFAIGRTVRIVPPYYACLVLFLVAMSARPPVFDVLTFFLFVNNLFDRTFYAISPHFWTMGMFVQFYIGLPLLFAGCRLVTTRAWATVVLLGMVSVGAYLAHLGLMATRTTWMPALSLIEFDSSVLARSTLAHLPHFLLGVLGGYALTKWSAARPFRAPGRAADWVFWLSMAGLVFVAGAPEAERWQLPYGRYVLPWMPVLAAVVMVAGPWSASGRRVLELAPFRWLGTISYGVYIYHMLCMQFVRRVLESVGFESAEMKWAFAVLSLVLTIVVATSSYLALERPFLRWWRRYPAVAGNR